MDAPDVNAAPTLDEALAAVTTALHAGGPEPAPATSSRVTRRIVEKVVTRDAAGRIAAIREVVVIEPLAEGT